MKSIILLVAFSCIAIAWATSCGYTHGHNGRPGCVSEEELTRPWRNNFDPTRYWQCVNISTPAVKVLCPNGQAFLEAELRCVEWAVWNWTAPCDPPTMSWESDYAL